MMPKGVVINEDAKLNNVPTDDANTSYTDSERVNFPIMTIIEEGIENTNEIAITTNPNNIK